MDLLLGQFSPSSSSRESSEPPPQQQPDSEQRDEASDLAAAHQVISEAAKRAGSLFKSLQAAIQIDQPMCSSLAGVWGSNEDRDGEADADPRLPWTPRTDDERCVARQLRQRMLAIAEQPELFLEQSPQSCNIDVGTAISEAAGAVLQHDPQLRALRFHLVPKHISEEVFWARYFGQCNRVRQEVLLEGPVDTDLLGHDASGMVCVPSSPEVVLREERFQQPEATEAAGRWLETFPHVISGKVRATWPPPPSTQQMSTGEETTEATHWQGEASDFAYAMMAGDEGGLLPGISNCMATLHSGRPGSGGRATSSGSSGSRFMESAGEVASPLTSPSASLMSPDSGTMSPAALTGSGSLPARPSSRGSGSGSCQMSNAAEAAAAALDSFNRAGIAPALPGSQGVPEQQLQPQRAEGAPKPQSVSNPTSMARAATPRPPTLRPPREAGRPPREAGAPAYPSPSSAQRLRRLADTLAAARLLCLEDMAHLTISPAAAHAEATGTWGGAILRAVGSGRGGAAAAAVVASVAQSPEAVHPAAAAAQDGRRGLRLPGLGSRVEQQAVDTRGAATQLATANDEVMAAVWKLFEPMPPSPLMSPRDQGRFPLSSAASPRRHDVPSADSPVPWGLPTASAGVEITGWSLEAEVGGAPPRGFLAAVVSAMCQLRRVGQMAMFWSEVVDELDCHWSSLRTVVCVPAEQPPDVGVCILQQRLQLLNVAISCRRARQAKARCSPRQTPEGPAVPAGATHAVLGLTLRHGSATVWAPLLQSVPLFNEDLCRDFPSLTNCMRGPGAVLRQAVSDMSAFRAVNDGAVPHDYTAWCEKEGRPLPHQLDALLGSVPSSEFYPLRHVQGGAAAKPIGGSPSSPATPPLAAFQLSSPASWEDLFWSAIPVASPQQVPLFNAEVAGRAVLDSIRAMAPSDVFEQLFLVAVVMEHAEAAASPLLHSSQALETALHEVRCFAATTCGRGMSENKLSRICQVFERLQDMFTAVAKEHQHGTVHEGLPLSSSLSSSSLIGSMMEVDDDEWTMI